MVEKLLSGQGNSLDDAILIRRSQQGDRRAFGEIVTKYQDRLHNAACRMTNNREDAADIVQETFLKAFGAIDGFKGGSSLYTWLYQIAVNTMISLRRRRKVRKEDKKVPLITDDNTRVCVDPPDRHPGPEEKTLQAELRGRIERAIAELDEEHRILVVLKDIEGLDYEQISRIVGCPRGTVKSRLHRARLKLRDALADVG